MTRCGATVGGIASDADIDAAVTAVRGARMRVGTCETVDDVTARGEHPVRAGAVGHVDTWFSTASADILTASAR